MESFISSILDFFGNSHPSFFFLLLAMATSGVYFFLIYLYEVLKNTQYVILEVKIDGEGAPTLSAVGKRDALFWMNGRASVIQKEGATELQFYAADYKPKKDESLRGVGVLLPEKKKVGWFAYHFGSRPYQQV